MSGDVFLMPPTAHKRAKGAELIPHQTRRYRPAGKIEITPTAAVRIIAIYQAHYAECAMPTYVAPSGSKVFFHPRLETGPEVGVYRDNASGGDQAREYFHAGDLKIYRAALRVVYHGASITMADVAPINFVRPRISAADQDFLNRCY